MRKKLTGWLRIEVGKSRKQKRTAKAMHTDLVALGFDGGYGCVAAFVRAWKAERQREQQTSGRGTFVPLVPSAKLKTGFAPGEVFQFDWSADWAVIAGERTKLQAAHSKLSHSRAFIVRAYPQPSAPSDRWQDHDGGNGRCAAGAGAAPRAQSQCRAL